MFQHVTPGTRSVLTPGASYEQHWYRSTRRCYIPNIKAVGLPHSEKKKFEICLLCSYAPTCDPRARPVLTLGASYEQTWKRSTRRYFIQNIKALGHPVSEKKNYEIFVLCSYVQLVTPRAGLILTPGAFYEQAW